MQPLVRIDKDNRILYPCWHFEIQVSCVHQAAQCDTFDESCYIAKDAVTRHAQGCCLVLKAPVRWCRAYKRLLLLHKQYSRIGFLLRVLDDLHLIFPCASRRQVVCLIDQKAMLTSNLYSKCSLLVGQQHYSFTLVGSTQSAVPHQTGSTSTAQPKQDRSKGPALSLKMPKQPQAQPLLDEHHHSIPAETSHGATALRQAQPLPHQNQQSGPAHSGRAGRRHQPQGLQQDTSHVRSSPLYAASESEDSECESSAGNHAKHQRAQSCQDLKSNPARSTWAARGHTSSTSNAVPDAQKPEAKKGDVVIPQPARQTRASSGQASRAAKPPTGRAQGRAKPTAPVKQAGRQKGGKLAGPGDEDDLEGFGLLSEDEQLPMRPSKGGLTKPDGTAQVGRGVSQHVTSCSRNAQRALPACAACCLV